MKKGDFHVLVEGDARRYIGRTYQRGDGLPEVHIWNADETKQVTITVEEREDGDYAIVTFRDGGNTVTLFGQRL